MTFVVRIYTFIYFKKEDLMPNKRLCSLKRDGPIKPGEL